MERDYEQLVQYLKDEEQFYSELLELSFQKKKSIIANDVDTLNFIIEKEKNIVLNISNIEKSRTRCTTNIGRRLNLGDAPTLTQIIDVSEEDVLELKTLLKEFKKTLTQVKTENLINNDLVKDQLGFIDSFKSAFFGSQSNYGIDGKDVTTKRQNVNLLDRMV